MERYLIQSRTLVLLDAGHGEDTPGKRSPIWEDGSQLFEWAFNRVLVQYIKDYLKLGVSYVVLVPENEDILLEERIDRIERIHKAYKDDFDLIYLVSIHGNAFKTSSPNGIEVYTTRGITEADPIAKKYFYTLKQLGWNMRFDYEDGYPDREANFYIIREAEKLGVPGILTENGFYTNREDCSKMLDFFWQKKIAQAHYDAAFQIERIYRSGKTIEDYYI